MLTDEQMNEVFRRYFDLKDGGFVGKQIEFARAIEAECCALQGMKRGEQELRKQDEALIRQMRDALVLARRNVHNDFPCVAEQAANARLGNNDAPPSTT